MTEYEKLIAAARKLAAEGKKQRQIAEALGISQPTVQRTLARIQEARAK